MKIVLMASAAIMKKDTQELLVVKRSKKEEFLSGYWTGIGGKIEDLDTTIEEAVKREVKEETGLEVDIQCPLRVAEFTREDRPGTKAVEITYLCYPKNNTEVTLSEEHDEFRWVNKDSWKELEPITNMQKDNLKRIFDTITRIFLIKENSL
jgi:8-oxo-dGTP pyrophosphatase MutT (NUDIX family)